MRSSLYVCAAVLSLAVAAPASAAVTMNNTGSYTFTGTSGGQAVISFDGYGGTSPAVIPGLSSILTLTFQSLVGTLATFAYTLQNTSSVSGATVTSLGFNTNPDIIASGSGSSGAFNILDTNNNFPVGFGNVEVCTTSGANSNGNACTGGNPGDGIGQGTTGMGTLTLNFSSAPTNGITLDNFVDRYQAFDVGGVQSAIGRPTGAVPEPATWAMMLVGFGLLGGVMRRRKQPVVRSRVSYA